MMRIICLPACIFATISFLGSYESSGNFTDAACALSGFVVDAVLGEKVQDATVELAALPSIGAQSIVIADLFPGAPPPLNKRRYTALSGPGGQFCFSELPQGQYVLSARKEGFLDSNYGTLSPWEMPQIIDIKQEQYRDTTLRMWPAATISGMVSDTGGQPVTSGVVEALTTVWFRGRPHTVVIKAGRVTTAGAYKVAGMQPETYYVRFRSADSALLCGACIPSQQVERTFVPTYYRSGSAPRDAVPIQLSVGQRVSLNIVANRGVTFTVSGRLRISGIQPEYASLWLVDEHEEPTAWVIGNGMTDPEGGFRFFNVAPGAYGLFYLAGRTEGMSVGRIDVAVKDRDVVACDIDAPQPVRLRGTVAIEGLGGATLKGTKLVLTPTDRIMDPSCIGEVQDNGEVVLEGCSAGRYRVALASLAHPYYVKRILYAGDDITNGFLVATQNSGKLRIVLRQGAERIRGTFSSAKSAWYVVVPAELPVDVLPAQIRVGHSDSMGGFVVEGLPPGRFAVVGIAAPNVSTLHNPKALGSLAALGTEVRVGENEEAYITTPVISSLSGR